MTRVITYGTFDVLHIGHLNLLKRAKALGDYLIVGVTSDDFDLSRGKINNTQSLMERIKGVRETGLADEIIVEEYEGQKIDDIKRRNIDIFTLGSDWVGKYDYLNEYCKVVYLPRTEGISSSQIRSEHKHVRIGVVGHDSPGSKFVNESKLVNGVEIVGFYSNTGIKTGFTDTGRIHDSSYKLVASENIYSQIAASNVPSSIIFDSYTDLLAASDAIYITSMPENHYQNSLDALKAGKHVLCESPGAYTRDQYAELKQIADDIGLILMEGIKTAYSTAYERLILLAQSGKIGDIISVDSVCTSLSGNIYSENVDLSMTWNSMCAWGVTALLPIFQLMGTDYIDKKIYSYFMNKEFNMDAYTKVDFTFDKGIASMRVGKGAKSEGNLVITGTKGYIYVPAPWWKTDYFEVRYEDIEKNERFFYQLSGEGIRYMIASFVKSIELHKNLSYITPEETAAIVGVIEDFNDRRDMIEFRK